MLGGVLMVLGFSIAGTVAAHADAVTQTDTSPSMSVVARLPTAVSVTFSGTVRSKDAELLVSGPGGDATDGKTEVVDDAIRRPLADDLPGGLYTVTWTVQDDDENVLSGQFTFTAARGNGKVVAPTRTASPPPNGPSSPAAQPVPPASPTAAPTTAGSSPTGTPSSSAATGSDATWPAALDQRTPPPAHRSSLPAGLIAVPLLMAAALVLASAVVGLARAHRRNPARPTVTLAALLHRGN